MEISSVSRRGENGYSAFDPDRGLDCGSNDEPTCETEALNRETEHPGGVYPEWVRRIARIDDISLPNPDPLDFDVPPQKDDSTSVPVLLADASAVLPPSPTATDALPPPLEPAKQARFREGPIVPPIVRHDHGFLGKGPDRSELAESKRREPTLGDKVALAGWISKLRGAQLLRPDLKEACAAYEHYLFGKGVPLILDYERFVVADASGRAVLQSALEDSRIGAVKLHDRSMSSTPPAARTDTFTMESNVVVVGNTDNRYPYPETENWQKAIGGHAVWIEAAVTVSLEPATNRRQFEIDVLIHADDMYNFDPEKEDIATGAPDEANGRFQECGLADEFLSAGMATRKIKFSLPLVVPDPRVVPVDLVVTGGPSATPAPVPGTTAPSPPPPQ